MILPTRKLLLPALGLTSFVLAQLLLMALAPATSRDATSSAVAAPWSGAAQVPPPASGKTLPALETGALATGPGPGQPQVRAIAGPTAQPVAPRPPRVAADLPQPDLLALPLQQVLRLQPEDPLDFRTPDGNWHLQLQVTRSNSNQDHDLRSLVLEGIEAAGGHSARVMLTMRNGRIQGRLDVMSPGTSSGHYAIESHDGALWLSNELPLRQRWQQGRPDTLEAS